MGAELAIRQAFTDAGVQGWLYARAVHENGREIAVDADAVVPIASLYKLALLVAYLRAVDAGALDPAARTTLRPVDRSAGAAGVSLLQDNVTMSWRDLVVSMIAMSDNAAADAVHTKIGPSQIRLALDDLNLFDTHVHGDARAELAAVLRGTASSTAEDAFRALADADRPTPDYLLLSASTSTPREITRLLVALWTDAAASPAQCAFARSALLRRLGPHRLRLGFPLDSVAVAEKSGTLGALRHSAGVVRFDADSSSDEAYAVTVFTQAARADRVLPRAEAAIGHAAQLAVDALRLPTRKMSG